MKALSFDVVKSQAENRLTRQEEVFTPTPVSQADQSANSQIWIGLHFPSLSLDVCQFDGDLPVVIIDQSGNRQTVHSACAVAQDHGITAGMSLNAAHALCRNLDVKLRDPAAEYRQLQRYGQQLLCFTPAITLGLWQTAVDTTIQKRKVRTVVNSPADNADSLLLEVSSSLRLYQGLPALLEKIRTEFCQSKSLSPIISVAPCPSAALLMARNGREDIVLDASDLRSVLGSITLYSVDLPRTLVEKLSRCGLRNLRDCWRLPRADLGRRFSESVLHYLDRICAEQPEPVEYIDAPLSFRQRIELPIETRQHHLIVIAVEKLLEEVHQFLQMHNAATEKIRFDLWHVTSAYDSNNETSRSRTTLIVQTAQADRRPERFLPQLGEQLERLTIEDDINAVSVMVDQVLPYVRSSEDLFERRDRQQQDFSQLIDVLCARLGQEQVYTLTTTPDHRPEFAWQRCQLMGKETRHKDKKNNQDQQTLDYVTEALPSRPIWLLDQPRPIDHHNLPSSQTVERIEAGWWMRADIRREYRVEQAMPKLKQYQQRWLYRDLKQTDQSAWYVHGLFA